MKYIFSFLLSLSFIFNAAQDVSQYKYISIPASFTGFERGQYQMNNYLRLLLSQKNYEILSDQRSFWPDEAKLNPCHVLFADVDRLNSTFNNKILLKFIDCNQTVVQEFEGESKIKEFDSGYKDALKNASDKLKNQNAEFPTYRQDETKVVEIVSEKTIANPGTALFKKYSKQPAKVMNHQTNQVFVDQRINYTKTDLENKQFILNSEDEDIVFHFIPSSKSGIYHVSILKENSTISALGFYDGKDLIYEYISENQIPVKVVLKLK